MNQVDTEYFRLLQEVLTNGRKKSDRTGTGTLGVFGAQSKFKVDLNAFPILTTKKIFFKAIVHELLWFLSGSTNIKYLVDNGISIWDRDCFARYNRIKPSQGGLMIPDPFLLTKQEKRILKGEPLPEDKDVIERVKFNIDVKRQRFISKIKEDPKFAEEWGDLGDGTYGQMWRAFPYADVDRIDGMTSIVQVNTVDQIQKVIDKLKTNPDDRRMIVSAWHPYLVDHCALPPCHTLFQFHTEELTLEERVSIGYQDKYNLQFCGSPDLSQWTHEDFDGIKVPRRRLNCQLYQRSADAFLGICFNFTSYSLLMAMIAQCVNMDLGMFTHTFGDLHIYNNHLDQVKLQLTREPRLLPKLYLNPAVRDLFQFKFEDITLEGYDPHPAIKGEQSF